MKRKQSVAQYITSMIAASGKPQHQIAIDCDWPKPNMVSMIKSGATKVPLDRVGLLAISLGIDPRDLLRRCLAEYIPDTLRALDEMHPGLLLTNYEHEIIEAYRAVAGDENFHVAIFRSPFTLVEPVGSGGDAAWLERGPHSLVK